MAFLHWLFFTIIVVRCVAYAVEFEPEPNLIAMVTSTLRGNVPVSEDSSTCVSCQKSAVRLTAEEMHAKKIEQEKQKILAKLQLTDPPNVVVDPRDIPSVLRERMNDDFVKNSFDPGEEETEDVDIYGKMKGFFIFGEHPKRGVVKNLHCLTKDNKHAVCVDMKMSHEIAMKEIVNATLWLYKFAVATTLNDDTLQQQQKQTHIIRINELHNHHNRAADEELVGEIETNIGEGWLEIDVTSLVESWRHRKHATRRHNSLQFSCITCEANVIPIATTADERPFLEIKTGVSNKRKKRSNVCSPELYSNCCLKPFYVNFTEIGWNTWIIQPPGYYANYCTGSCRMTSTTGYNSVVRTVGLTKEVRGENYDRELIPCCSPTKMSPLSLLYAFNDGEIRKKVLDNMIVKSCGC